MTLKDDVKGMFNDRKMNVREEQRAMDSTVCLPSYYCLSPLLRLLTLSPPDPTAQPQDQRDAQQ